MFSLVIWKCIDNGLPRSAVLFMPNTPMEMLPYLIPSWGHLPLYELWVIHKEENRTETAHRVSLQVLYCLTNK